MSYFMTAYVLCDTWVPSMSSHSMPTVAPTLVPFRTESTVSSCFSSLTLWLLR
jgi:hypothetical protein